MEVFNRTNSRLGGGGGLRAYLLIGRGNTGREDVSLQYSEVEPGAAQPLHQHAPAQCYFLIEGRGLMTIGLEERELSAGDAVYVPPEATHGIVNTGTSILRYVTANSPAFDQEYERRLWPQP